MSLQCFFSFFFSSSCLRVVPVVNCYAKHLSCQILEREKLSALRFSCSFVSYLVSAYAGDSSLVCASEGFIQIRTFLTLFLYSSLMFLSLVFIQLLLLVYILILAFSFLVLLLFFSLSQKASFSSCEQVLSTWCLCQTKASQVLWRDTLLSCLYSVLATQVMA